MFTYDFDGNSVNMTNAASEKKTYHHGDLRSALIEAGLKLLDDRAADDVGLREVARAVGVSATAVYRHFPDKQALRAALAREGLERLGAEQHAAAEAAGGGEAGFAATGKAYVRFALANPALFRLIFASGAAPADLDCKDDAATMLLRQNAVRIAGGEGRAAQAVALHAWSLVHGLAMLMLDGQVPAEDALIEAVLDSGGG